MVVKRLDEHTVLIDTYCCNKRHIARQEVNRDSSTGPSPSTSLEKLGKSFNKESF